MRPKQQKLHRARMPYKRSSRISRHFWSPDLTRVSDEKEFFQQPRLLSPTEDPLVRFADYTTKWIVSGSPIVHAHPPLKKVVRRYRRNARNTHSARQPRIENHVRPASK